MKINKSLIFLAALASLALASCDASGDQPKSSQAPGPVDDGTATVFVLSGQSNMEGSTTYVSASGDQWLRNAFDKLNDEYDLDLDISYFEDDEGNVTRDAPGVPEVMTSFFGFYPPSGPNGANASNKEDKRAGKFVPTNVGMGNQERFRWAASRSSLTSCTTR